MQWPTDTITNCGQLIQTLNVQILPDKHLEVLNHLRGVGIDEKVGKFMRTHISRLRHATTTIGIDISNIPDEFFELGLLIQHEPHFNTNAIYRQNPFEGLDALMSSVIQTTTLGMSTKDQAKLLRQDIKEMTALRRGALKWCTEQYQLEVVLKSLDNAFIFPKAMRYHLLKLADENELQRFFATEIPNDYQKSYDLMCTLLFGDSALPYETLKLTTSQMPIDAQSQKNTPVRADTPQSDLMNKDSKPVPILPTKAPPSTPFSDKLFAEFKGKWRTRS
jgi:hypothetical protein